MIAFVRDCTNTTRTVNLDFWVIWPNWTENSFHKRLDIRNFNYCFQQDGTVQLFGTKGQKFLRCPGTKEQWDKLKILPRDRTGRDSLSKSGKECGTRQSLFLCQTHSGTGRGTGLENHYFFQWDKTIIYGLIQSWVPDWSNAKYAMRTTIFFYKHKWQSHGCV